MTVGTAVAGSVLTLAMVGVAAGVARADPHLPPTPTPIPATDADEASLLPPWDMYTKDGKIKGLRH